MLRLVTLLVLNFLSFTFSTLKKLVVKPWIHSYVIPFLVQLMELQSRFGTDERFRMDSRFLEDEDEEEDDKAASGLATYLDLLW